MQKYTLYRKTLSQKFNKSHGLVLTEQILLVASQYVGSSFLYLFSLNMVCDLWSYNYVPCQGIDSLLCMDAREVGFFNTFEVISTLFLRSRGEILVTD